VAATASYSVIRSNSCSTHSILRGVDIQGAASEKLSRSKCTVVSNFLRPPLAEHRAAEVRIRADDHRQMAAIIPRVPSAQPEWSSPL
jgi:hypothetical protein